MRRRSSVLVGGTTKGGGVSPKIMRSRMRGLALQPRKDLLRAKQPKKSYRRNIYVSSPDRRWVKAIPRTFVRSDDRLIIKTLFENL